MDQSGETVEGRLFAEHPYGKGESDREDRAGLQGQTAPSCRLLFARDVF